MKQVYVVTSGDYSDYRIEAIFETEEEANEFMAKIAAKDPEVKPWPLNTGVEPVFTHRATLYDTRANGEIEVEADDYCGLEDKSDSLENALAWAKSERCPLRVFGTSEEHARRRLLELRDLAIRTRDGI